MKITYMELNTCSKVLFVLLITIIVLAIIIAVIYNCKRETFDLGKSIDHLVDGAIGSVSDTMDDLGDSDALIDIEYNNAPIYINTDGDLHAYEKDGSHHGVKITSGDSVSKQDSIPSKGTGSGSVGSGGGSVGARSVGSGSVGSGGVGSGGVGSGSVGSGSVGSGGGSVGARSVGARSVGSGGGSVGSGNGGNGSVGSWNVGSQVSGSRRGGGNLQCIDCTDPSQNLDYKNAPNKCACNSSYQACKKCSNCTWCTGGEYKVCAPNNNLPENCTNKPPSTKGDCYVGTGSLKKETSHLNGYNSQACDLHKNYKLCLDCAKKGKCGTPSVNGGVQCGNPKEEDDDGCLGRTYDKKNTVRNCLNPPDDTPLSGFGCPGLDYSSPSIAPIDPTKNNGSVCLNHP